MNSTPPTVLSALSLYSSCISQKPRVIEKFGLVDLTMFLAKFAPTEIKRRQNDNRQRRAVCRVAAPARHRRTRTSQTEYFLLFLGAN